MNGILMIFFTGLAQYHALAIRSGIVGRLMTYAYDIKAVTERSKMHVNSLDLLLSAIDDLSHFPSPSLLISVLLLAMSFVFSRSVNMVQWQKIVLILVNVAFVLLHIIVPAIT